jgi:hypothetical protein
MRQTREMSVAVRFRLEAARHGYWRAGVVFTWRRTRRACRFAFEDAFDAHDRRKAAARQRGDDTVVLREFAANCERWGCSVVV